MWTPAGKTAFFAPEVKRDSLYDAMGGTPQVLTDKADAKTVVRINRMIENWLVLEPSALTYALQRRFVSLNFHESEPSASVRHEYSKLSGCDACGGPCDGTRASCCKGCALLTWWCSLGCRESSKHARKCPIGSREAILAVQFGVSA
mgnify:FL=1